MNKSQTEKHNILRKSKQVFYITSYRPASLLKPASPLLFLRPTNLFIPFIEASQFMNKTLYFIGCLKEKFAFYSFRADKTRRQLYFFMQIQMYKPLYKHKEGVD